MKSVPADPLDLSKGYIYTWDDDDSKSKPKSLTEPTKIWICLQLYIGQTPKQIQRKLKVHTLQQIKNVPNCMYKHTGSTYMQWWTAFLPEGNVRGAGELYYLRLIDLSKMVDDLSISPWEHYESKDEYELDVERLKESISLLIECFYQEE